jgi:hypothetical protein
MEIFTMHELLGFLGKEHLLTNLSTTGSRTLYHSLNLYVPNVKLNPHTLYLAQCGSLPENLATAKDAGCILLPMGAGCEVSIPSTGVSCEWAVWDEPQNLIEMFNAIQNTVSLQYNKSQFQQFLVSSLASNRSIDMLIQQAAEIVQNPIALFDPAFRVLAMESLGFEVDDPFWIEAKKQGVLSLDSVRLLKESGITDLIEYAKGPAFLGANDAMKVPRLAKKLYSPQGNYLGTVTIYQCNKPLTKEDYYYIDSLGSLLSVKMQYTPHATDEQKHIYDLIRKLLDGIPIKDLPSEGIRSFKKLSALPMFRIGYIKMSDQPALVRQIEYFRSSLFSDQIGTYTTQFHQDLVIVFGAQNHEDMALKMEMANANLSKLKMCMGVSRSFSSISEARPLFLESKLALRFGLKYFPESFMFLYEQISIFKLFEGMGTEALLEYYKSSPHAILREYDDRKGTEFCNTLHQFTLEMGNHVKTAQKLFIHKNTLIYRLSKISSLTCLDLSLEKSLHDFYFSALVYKYLKTLSSSDNSVHLIQ